MWCLPVVCALPAPELAPLFAHQFLPLLMPSLGDTLPRNPPCAAVGAVFIAAVGVWGVFKMAFYVASETGRSMNADKADSSSGGGGSSAGSSGEGGGAGVKAASPLEPQHFPQLLMLPGAEHKGHDCGPGPGVAGVGGVGVGPSQVRLRHCTGRFSVFC